MDLRRMSNKPGSFDLADFDTDLVPSGFVPEIVEPNANCIDKGEDSDG